MYNFQNGYEVHPKVNKDNYLIPRCLTTGMEQAITNRGHLLPCCRCDHPKTMNDPEFQKLTDVSYISDYNKIDDILKTKEWKQFYISLKNNNAPWACWDNCRDTSPYRQTITVVDKKNITKEIR